MIIVVISTLAVAIVAGLRGVWSPCGLSMLSTITPIGERGRGTRYATTARWYVLGAAVGGLSLGAACAVVGVVVPARGTMQLVVIALAALIAAASDVRVGGRALPTHRRQVNERWLDQYRSWVYGAGFGWQIGTGLATYITTAAVYLLVVLATIAGSPAVALAGALVFGVTRGLAVLSTRTVSTPVELQELHRAVQRAGPSLHRAVITVEVGVAALAGFAVDVRVGVVVAIAGALLLLEARRRPLLVCDLDAERRTATVRR
jgi:hypothetical protein